MSRTHARVTSLQLTEAECWDLVRASTIGRLAFHHPDGIKVVPVSYVLDSQDVIIRTSPAGLASHAVDAEDVAFEVDDYNTTTGNGWTVLSNGSVAALSETEHESPQLPTPPTPWAEGNRSLSLRFTAQAIDGRRVQRRP
ncbi:MAG TPA: pyridoxamine 5'-phosphate oxidase family protein [Microlunatus sp.]